MNLKILILAEHLKVFGFFISSLKNSTMKNPKVLVKQNGKGEWSFANIDRNGNSTLIGGETVKNKPTQKKLETAAKKFLLNIINNKIEYKPRKKK